MDCELTIEDFRVSTGVNKNIANILDGKHVELNELMNKHDFNKLYEASETTEELCEKIAKKLKESSSVDFIDYEVECTKYPYKLSDFTAEVEILDKKISVDLNAVFSDGYTFETFLEDYYYSSYDRESLIYDIEQYVSDYVNENIRYIVEYKKKDK